MIFANYFLLTKFKNTILLAGAMALSGSGITCIDLTNILLVYYSSKFGTFITPPAPDNTCVFGSFVVQPRLSNYVPYRNAYSLIQIQPLQMQAIVFFIEM